MRFVVKPAGMIAVAVALAGLAFLAFGPMSGKNKAAAGSDAPPPIPVYLTNGNFEQSYKEYERKTGGDGTNHPHISGKIADGWFDNSEWADLTVRYSDDSQKPHGGATCQRIEIGEIKNGQVQFAEAVNVTSGAMYHATLWVRASQDADVTLGLRREAGDFSYFASSPMKVGKEWRPVEVIGTVGEPRIWLMLSTNKPNVTLWVDDAKVDPVEPTKAKQ